MRIAITRAVSPAIANCELTHVDRQPIDLERMRLQHDSYEKCLEKIGCKVIKLTAEAAFPDSMFVEDAAIVLDEVAVITRPGAVSRLPEADLMAAVMKSYRNLVFVRSPGTVDGGDVLRVGKVLYVGMSGRSNSEGADQMRKALAPFGYRVIPVSVTGCLHLKSAVTQVGDRALLINPNWVDRKLFEGVDFIEVDPSEPNGANCLWENGNVIYPSTFPKTSKKIETTGVPVHLLDVSEIAKAEGALTCCSLIFNA